MAWEDRSSGRITEDLWADMTSDWAAERSRLVETMRGHDRAEGQYLEVGVRIVEEARRVAAFYEATDAEPAARRHLLATILEDCQLKDGEVAVDSNSWPRSSSNSHRPEAFLHRVSPPRARETYSKTRF